MTARTTRPVHLLAALTALTAAGVLLVAADGSEAAPTGCHGLSPASAVGCPADVFADDGD